MSKNSSSCELTHARHKKTTTLTRKCDVTNSLKITPKKQKNHWNPNKF